jgi:large subunit ribosomal protein L10
MPRPEKVQAVADIKERLDAAQAVFLTEYAGLSVKEQQELRRQLKANGAEMKVVKMTLARRAAEDVTDELTELLIGPTSLTFADGDPAAAAKALKTFAADHAVLIIKGGLLGSEFLSPERISDLADLPSRDVLLAEIAGIFEAPMARLAGLLQALPRNAAGAFQQLLERREQESSELPAASDEHEAAETADEPVPPSEETPQDELEARSSQLEADAADEETAEQHDVSEDELETGDSELETERPEESAETEHESTEDS